MSGVCVPSQKRTIGRARVAERSLEDQPQSRSPRSILTAAVRWVRDPLGLAGDAGGWALSDDEVRADLEHGRD